MNKKTSMSGLSLRDLEYIQSIAHEGNFGAAASMCGVSQPAISQQVLKLEARLGFAIFERQGKHVSLTPSGRVVLRKAEIVLAEARELLELSRSLSDDLEGELKIGVIPTLGPYLLPHILKPLKAAYPSVQLRLFEEPTPVLEQMLVKRDLDAVLIATEPKQGHLDTLDLFFEPFVFANPAALSEEPDSPVPVSKVMQSDLVLLTKEHCLRDQTMALCEVAELQGQRVASSLEMLRYLVAGGEGSALFPALSVLGPDRFGGLVTLHPISGDDFGRRIRMSWRSSDPRAPYLAKLGQFIRSQMETDDMKKHLTPRA